MRGKISNKSNKSNKMKEKQIENKLKSLKLIYEDIKFSNDIETKKKDIKDSHQEPIKEIAEFQFEEEEHDDLHMIEFKGNFEKVLSKFRVESMKQVLTSKHLIEKSFEKKLNNQKLFYENEFVNFENKVKI